MDNKKRGNNGEREDMSMTLNKKYAHLKDKLKEISKNAPILKGKDGMVELDPNNPHHKEWFYEDRYKGE